MKNFYMKVTFVLILFLLVSLPLLQMKYDIFKKLALYGVSQPVEYPILTYTELNTGEYQKKFEAWFNQNFGLKDYYVKTNNQIYYSLFNQTPPNSQVIIGKEKYLYEGGYISEYLNFIPPLSPEFLEQKVIELKKLQELLQQRGKTFLLLITPSKASIYPEYIPERIKVSQTIKIRNYDVIIPLLNKYGVNYVDGHQITEEHKNSVKYAMFPQGGTHWNYLASYYTSKAALEKLGKLTGKNYVEFESIGVEETVPTGTDRDLANLINVWKTPINYLSPRQILVKKDTGGDYKPTLFMEGASFSEQFINTLHKVSAFKQFDLYFYYHTHIQYKEGEATGGVVGEIDKVNWDDVMNHDVIMIEMNESNIPKLQKGFLQDAIAQLDPIKLNFSSINKDFVEKTKVNGLDGFIFKKGANGSGTLYIESDKIKLIPGNEYTLSYKASGFKNLSVDLFPDDLPQYNQDKISDTPNEFSFDFKSDSQNMNAATVRFFIEGVSISTDKDTVVYDIKLTNKTQ